MGGATGTNEWNRPDPPGVRGQWQETIDLLKLVEDDYEGARRQLEKVGQTLAESKAVVNERLQYAFLQSRGCQTLCLGPHRLGAAIYLGSAILGEVTRPITPQRTSRLEVRCLGGFALSYQGNAVTRWRSVKAKSVFQYLVAHPREPVVKDTLMEALWPDCDPRVASNNLKAAVYGLRQTLGQLFDQGDASAHILFIQGCYFISREIDLWVDVEQFEQHYANGRRLEKAGKSTEAIREFQSAQALYRGDYLQDEPYGEWTLLRREALKDAYLTVLGKLADCAMDGHDYEGCIAYCHKILLKDSCREDIYRQLMRSYSRIGQRNRALRWYQICRQSVRTGLDADPDQDTEALFQRLLRNEHI